MDEVNQMNPSSEKVLRGNSYDWGKTFFQYRDYTPIPLIVILMVFAQPTVLTALLGVVVALCGEAIRIYAVAYIGKISRTRKDRTGGKLVKSGPFARVRNPLYVGNFIICMGIGIFAGKVELVLMIAVAFAIQYHFIVHYEETLLKETFGDEFQQYCSETPRWFPKGGKLWSRGEEAIEGDFTTAFQNERKTFMALFSVLVVLALLAM